MKTAISIPDPVYQAADRLAHRLGMSRSELYAKAVAAYLERHRREEVTAALDQIYGDAPASSYLPDDLRTMQGASIAAERW